MERPIKLEHTPVRKAKTISGTSGKGRLKLVFGLAVSLLCCYWVIQSVEKDEVLLKLKTVHVGFIVLAVITTLLSYLVRSWRWPYLFRSSPPDFFNSFRCLIIGFFMNNVLPARIGELVRAHLGGRATRQSRTTVLATVASERLLDGVAISLLFSILFSFGATAQEQHEGKEIYYVSFLFAFAAVATAALVYFRDLFFRVLERLSSFVPGKLSGYTLIRARKFVDGLEPLFDPSRLLVLIFSSAAVWGIELAVYYFVSLAFDQQLSIGALSLFLAAVNFSSLIPAAPGGIGVIEAFATLALVHIGINRETALAMVAVQHVIQYAVVGIPGALLFFLHEGGKLPDEALDDDGGGSTSVESVTGALQKPDRV